METITACELKEKLAAGTAILIDVREPAEYMTENIAAATLIPLGEVSLEKLPTTTTTIVVHCRSGKRSMEARKKLLTQNANLNIYSLEGGITAWKQAGYEVQHPRSSVIPLERQVQIAAGMLVLLGVLLTILVNQMFVFILGCIGVGLIFAGISGYCGMAKLLAKMPWNRF